MAKDTEVAVDASGFDRLLSTIEGTTKASKDMGDAFKKALVGEVLVGSINRIASGMKDGVAKEALGAAGAITQGFFQAGPVGAALAATSVAILKVGDALDTIESKATIVASRLSFARAQAGIIASDTAERQRLRAETIADDEARVAREKRHAEEAAAEQRRVRELAKARADAKKAADAEAKEYVEAETLRVAYLEQEIKDAAFAEELDAEAEHAKRLRDMRDEAAAAERERLQSAQMYAFAVKDEERRQELARVKEHDDAKRAAEARESQAAYARAKERNDRITGDFNALGDSLKGGLASSVGHAVSAITALDAAQIAAAVSAKDFGANTAAAAAQATSGVLQAVAQEATVKAIMYGAQALAATVLAPTTAPQLWGAAGGMALAAVTAGAGAVALNSVAPKPPPASPGRTEGSGASGGTGGGTGRSVTVVVNANDLFATRDEVGASIDWAMKQAARYGRV